MAFIPIAMAAVAAIGAMKQGQAADQAAQQQAAASEYNARVSGIQARQAYDAGTQNELAQRRSQAQQKGATRAAAAESGLNPSSGSMLLAQGQSARDMELDALTTRYEGLLQGSAYDQQATMDSYSAGTLRASGKNAKKAGAIGAAAGILSGMSGYGSKGSGMRIGGTSNYRG